MFLSPLWKNIVWLPSLSSFFLKLFFHPEESDRPHIYIYFFCYWGSVNIDHIYFIEDESPLWYLRALISLKNSSDDSERHTGCSGCGRFWIFNRLVIKHLQQQFWQQLSMIPSGQTEKEISSHELCLVSQDVLNVCSIFDSLQ